MGLCQSWPNAATMSTDPTKQAGLSKLVDTRELRKCGLKTWPCGAPMKSGSSQLTERFGTPIRHSRKLSKSAKLKIDFADPRPEVDPKSQAEAWEKLLGFGVISPVDIALERNPDLKNREEALAYLLTIEKENRELNTGERNFVTPKNPPPKA